MTAIDLMDMAKVILRKEESTGRIESFTLEESISGKFKLFIDFEDDTRKIYCYSEAKEGFVYEKSVQF